MCKFHTIIKQFSNTNFCAKIYQQILKKFSFRSASQSLFNILKNIPHLNLNINIAKLITIQSLSEELTCEIFQSPLNW